jgi:hypothetical protein
MAKEYQGPPRGSYSATRYRVARRQNRFYGHTPAITKPVFRGGRLDSLVAPPIMTVSSWTAGTRLDPHAPPQPTADRHALPAHAAPTVGSRGGCSSYGNQGARPSRTWPVTKLAVALAGVPAMVTGGARRNWPWREIRPWYLACGVAEPSRFYPRCRPPSCAVRCRTLAAAADRRPIPAGTPLSPMDDQ